MRQDIRATAQARTLRQAMTPAERILWSALRDRRFRGLKFRRQVPLGPYIADFYCAECRLILEADGGHHADSPSDRLRDAWLAERGLRTLRFWNSDITRNLPGVLQRVADEVQR